MYLDTEGYYALEDEQRAAVDYFIQRACGRPIQELAIVEAATTVEHLLTCSFRFNDDGTPATELVAGELEPVFDYRAWPLRTWYSHRMLAALPGDGVGYNVRMARS